MSQAVLLSLPGSGDGSTQWRVETLQMINWGGFHGYTSVPFAPGSTLLSGASGTGKSSLLDAYLAIMMPSDTPFNGASNDATLGRTRGATQRNLLTYLRGKVDTNRESGSNEVRDQVLRGADSATWGALAATFVDDSGNRFSALRIYLVPRGATQAGEVTMKLATLEGRLDLRLLEPLRTTGFDKRTLEGRWPHLNVHPSYVAFSQKLFTRLGIGANGDGAKALRLLARIQAGHQIPSVDGLYKSMVLETPSTYAAADRAVQHFGKLEELYTTMVTAAEKSRLLSRLPQLWNEREDALATEALIDTFGVTRDDLSRSALTRNDPSRNDPSRVVPTPFHRWALATEQQLLDSAVETNRSQRRDVAARLKDAKSQQDTLKLSIEQIRQDQRENGGDRLERLRLEVKQLREERTSVETRRHTVTERTAVLGIALEREENLASAQQHAETFLAAVTEREEVLEAQRSELYRQGAPLTQRREEIVAELASLRQRTGLVPRPMHEARQLMASAAGLSESDLPFVAELIDLAPDQQAWRAAAEIALHSLARVMLVDVRHQEHLSRVIEPLQMQRINFTGVELDTSHEEAPAGPAQGQNVQNMEGAQGYISGKLVYKPSPFTAWVLERLQRSGTDALCVDSTDQLAGRELRITRSGQTRRGRDSAHGQFSARPIIGFNNADLIAQYEADQHDVEQQIAALSAQVITVQEQLRQLRGQQAAYQLILDTNWSAIDVAGLTASITEHEQQITQLLDSSDVLADLAATLQTQERDLAEVEAEIVRAEDRKQDLDTRHADLCDRQDTLVTLIDAHEQAGVILTDAQSAHLAGVYAQVADSSSLEGLPAGLRRLRSRLAEDSRTQRSRAEEATKTLCGIFEQYQARADWYDPNRGTTIADYPAYRDELDQLSINRLHELRQEWRDRLTEWSGQDLLPLHRAFDTAIEDIEERLIPVNDILTALPFGPQRDRLQIVLRRLTPADVVAFRRELKLLSSGATEELSEDLAELRFRRLRTFITKIRKPETGTSTSTPPGSGTTSRSSSRDIFLDVRKHVEITAVRIDQSGQQVATYAYLGDKSGGETQELVAFIVGAALRFQLGDEDRSRPRFAPIFLDEGFIKSDAEFAGRAVGAWQGLGFQLIVGAPLDKVTALEPAMDLLLSITKSPKGYSHLSDLRPGEPR